MLKIGDGLISQGDGLINVNGLFPRIYLLEHVAERMDRDVGFWSIHLQSEVLHFLVKPLYRTYRKGLARWTEMRTSQSAGSRRSSRIPTSPQDFCHMALLIHHFQIPTRDSQIPNPRVPALQRRNHHRHDIRQLLTRRHTK